MWDGWECLHMCRLSCASLMSSSDFFINTHHFVVDFLHKHLPVQEIWTDKNFFSHPDKHSPYHKAARQLCAHHVSNCGNRSLSADCKLCLHYTLNGTVVVWRELLLMQWLELKRQHENIIKTGNKGTWERLWLNKRYEESKESRSQSDNWCSRLDLHLFLL